MNPFWKSVERAPMLFKIEIIFPFSSKIQKKLISFIKDLSNYCSRYIQIWFDFEKCNYIPITLIKTTLKIIMKKNPNSFFDILLMGRLPFKTKFIEEIYNLERKLDPIPFFKEYNSFLGINKYNSDRILISYISPYSSILNQIQHSVKILHIKNINFFSKIKILMDKDIDGIFLDLNTSNISQTKKIMEFLLKNSISNVLWNDPLLMNIFLFKLKGTINSIIPRIRCITIHENGDISWTRHSPTLTTLQKKPTKSFLNSILHRTFSPQNECKMCYAFPLCNGMYKYLTKDPNCHKIKNLLNDINFDEI